mgnify:CR=1 FL=1
MTEIRHVCGHMIIRSVGPPTPPPCLRTAPPLHRHCTATAPPLRRQSGDRHRQAASRAHRHRSCTQLAIAAVQLYACIANHCLWPRGSLQCSPCCCCCRVLRAHWQLLWHKHQHHTIVQASSDSVLYVFKPHSALSSGSRGGSSAVRAPTGLPIWFQKLEESGLVHPTKDVIGYPALGGTEFECKRDSLRKLGICLTETLCCVGGSSIFSSRSVWTTTGVHHATLIN